MHQGKEQANTFKLEGINKGVSRGSVTTLQSNDLESENSFAKPYNVAPVESTIAVNGKQIKFKAAPYSFSVIRVKM